MALLTVGHGPQGREILGARLAAAGVGLVVDVRRFPGSRNNPDVEFAAYAAHTRTTEFTAALDEVLAEAAPATVAVMCSESVWWRCHRRLIADVAVLGRSVPVTHLMPDGRLTPHRPSDGAVVGPDGVLSWRAP